MPFRQWSPRWAHVTQAGFRSPCAPVPILLLCVGSVQAASSHWGLLWGAQTLHGDAGGSRWVSMASLWLSHLEITQNGLEATCMSPFCIICARVEWDLLAPLLSSHVSAFVCLFSLISAPCFTSNIYFFLPLKPLPCGVRTRQHSHSTSAFVWVWDRAE